MELTTSSQELCHRVTMRVTSLAFPTYTCAHPKSKPLTPKGRLGTTTCFTSFTPVASLAPHGLHQCCSLPARSSPTSHAHPLLFLPHSPVPAALNLSLPQNEIPFCVSFSCLLCGWSGQASVTPSLLKDVEDVSGAQRSRQQGRTAALN